MGVGRGCTGKRCWEFTLDLADTRRDLWAVVRFDLSVLLVGVAAVVAGVYLL